jgi:WD repeat-containing protein 35
VYIKAGDVKKAIDCCILLNQWNLAVELAEQHNFVAIETLLSRYATHLIQKDKKMEAVELYRKANKNTESARLLAEIASKLQAQRAPPLMIKKIYVLAAFEIDSYKQRVFDASLTQITGGGNTAEATAKTLNSLITTDLNNSADKALTNPWRGAEAIHFYLLCQRQLYQKEYKKAMKTAIRLKEYEKEIDTREIYSLVALSSYYNKCYKECSKAFAILERLPDISNEEREKFENIALSLFSRHAPKDAPQVKYPNPKKGYDNQISEYDTFDPQSGSVFSACIASGQSILAKEYYTCPVCKHKALYKELDYLNLKHCPLCHAPIETHK